MSSSLYSGDYSRENSLLDAFTMTSKLNPLASTSVLERLSLLISGAILNSYFIIPA